MKPSDESGASRAADVVPNSKSSSARAGVESVDHSSRRSGAAELPPPAWSDTIHCSSTCSPLTRSRCVGRASKNSFDTTMARPPSPAISDSFGSRELHLLRFALRREHSLCCRPLVPHDHIHYLPHSLRNVNQPHNAEHDNSVHFLATNDGLHHLLRYSIRGGAH